jgi:hypothetical protein
MNYEGSEQNLFVPQELTHRLFEQLLVDEHESAESESSVLKNLETIGSQINPVFINKFPPFEDGELDEFKQISVASFEQEM